jgi:UDP-N-acetylglucosamine transferase subunit ALG13
VIFVTVGSMYPFDRLIAAADAWAAANPGVEMLAQIGAGAPPRHMRSLPRMDQDTFDSMVRNAEIVVAHAGMGTVITAGRYARPLVILPRRVALGEQATDHQVGTADWLRGRPGIFVADEADALGPCIAAARAVNAEAIPMLEPDAPPEFLARLRDWLGSRKPGDSGAPRV